MLAAIGETLEPVDSTDPPPSLITGVIVSTRPQFYRLSIWTRSAPSDSDSTLLGRIETIGRNFKTNVLGYAVAQKLAGPLATEVEFLSHEDSGKKGRSAPKKITA